MKPPAFQFYADDFIGGTITMNHQERGLYILLLCLQWTQGKVTGDDIARLSSGMAQPLVSHVISKFEEVEPGVFQNARMEAERDKQTKFRANRSESGKAGADRRWHSHSTAIVLPLANDSSPSPSPSPINTKTGRFAPPSSEELKFYAAKIGLPDSEASAFFNYYESNGWKVGKNPMRKWESAMINWKKNWEEKRTKYSKPSIPVAQPRCGVGHNFV